MLPSDSYSELINRVYSRSNQEGSRPFPVASFEIYLLTQAQERAQRREARIFRQLGEIFDWDMSRSQQNRYLKKLQTGYTFVLTDLTRTILWTSNSFLSMTGYGNTEAIGRTPRMLQGPSTDRETLSWIQESLLRANPVKAELLNYRKGGETYLCHVQIDPLYDNQGQLTHFLAIEREVAA